MALRVDDVDLDRDRTLVRRFQAGDNEAFDELYRRYYERLERFCQRRVGDRHTAEELAQEAFARALTALPDLGGDLRFYPWMSVIAANLCVDSHRRRARSEPAPNLDPGSVAGGQEAIVDAVDVSTVVTALRRLAPRHQDVLQLREIEGWSYRRIADHYGVTVGTVETLLFRARRALRREFRLIEGGSLVATPAVAWVVGRAARIRLRLPRWLPATPSPGSVAAAAATATAAAVAFVVVPAPSTPPPAPPAAVAAAPTTTGRPPARVRIVLATTATPPPVAATTGAPGAGGTLTPPTAAPVAATDNSGGPSKGLTITAAGAPAAPSTTTTTTAAGAGSPNTGSTTPDLNGTVGALTSPITVPPTVGNLIAALPQTLSPVTLPPVGGVSTAPAVGAVTNAATGVLGGLLGGR